MTSTENHSPKFTNTANISINLTNVANIFSIPIHKLRKSKGYYTHFCNWAQHIHHPLDPPDSPLPHIWSVNWLYGFIGPIKSSCLSIEYGHEEFSLEETIFGALTARRTKKMIKNHQGIKESINTNLWLQQAGWIVQGIVFRVIQQFECCQGWFWNNITTQGIDIPLSCTLQCWRTWAGVISHY
jgi:hypothetical protein